jgi:hypothetical protein
MVVHRSVDPGGIQEGERRMSTPEGFDIWDAEAEPVPHKVWTTYHFTLPTGVRRKLAEGGVKTYPWVYINVDDFGVVQIDTERSHWFTSEEPLKKSQLRALIYEWLAEWELIQRQPIGPEDYEWFITEKFDKVKT